MGNRAGGAEDLAMGYGLVSLLLLASPLFQFHLVYGKKSSNWLEAAQDDSRELAAKLFPNLSPMLKRKKDHGRAEALLIAAYGKGLNPRLDESCESKTPVEL